jgi:hypothetical protein
MLRFMAAAAIGIALLAVVKREQVLERAHIVGACTTYAQAADGSEWRECYPGRISGRPSLKLNNCTPSGFHGDNQLWHCPAQLASNTARQ